MRCGAGKGLASYLIKYVASPPIAVSRITEYAGQEVEYYWQDHKSHKQERDIVIVVEFIRALKLAVKVGFTPLEAIRIATLNGATFLKVQDRTGSIAVGKEADLPVVRGDPSVSIEDIENVEEVFANGRAYDPNALISTVKGLAGWR
jgi:adenine deaminase